MICTRCRLFITNPDATECPQCGQPLGLRRGSGAVGSGGFAGPPSGSMPAEPPRSRPSASGGFPRAPGYGPWQEEGASSPQAGPPAPTYESYSPPPAPAATPRWEAPAPLPQRPRKSSTKKTVSIVLGSIFGGIAFCVILVLVLAAIGRIARVPSARSTPTPFAGTAPGQTVIFQDTLAADSGQWTLDPEHCFFQDGAYHVENGVICYASAGNGGDVSIRVDVKQVAGPTNMFYGITFRRASKGNHYEFEIDGNSKWSFGKVVNGTYMDIMTQSSLAIKGGLNTTNTLLVQARGAHFVLSVNGTNVGELDDATFSTGLTGLGVGENIEVAFTNFEITTP